MSNDTRGSDGRVPRTVRRQGSSDVLRFQPRQDHGAYVPSSQNPYDGYDAIDTADNPYDGYDAIDPDAPDEPQPARHRAPRQRQVRAGGQPRASQQPYRQVSAAPAPYDGYDYDRGGYSMGANTPTDGRWTGDEPTPYVDASYGQPAQPSSNGRILRRRRTPQTGQPVSSYDEAAWNQAYGYGGNGYGAPVGGGEGGGPRKPRRHLRHRGLIILAAIIVVVVGMYAVVFSPIDQKLAFSQSASEGLSQQLSWNIPCTPYYVLALGSDARDGDTVSRTDTMILARIDPIASKVTMVSIPRDTMVQVEGHGTQKINAAYAFGGAAGAVQAVHELTGASINDVAVVNFDGIAGIVDYLGGITVNVPVAVNDPNYTGLVMSAGEHTMDGNTAMLFSRVRHGFANGDFQRQEDQRLVLEAILSKCLSMNVTQLPGLADTLGDLVSTNMKCYSLIPLMGRFMITHPTIYSCSIPGTSQTIDGVSYVVTDSSQIQTIMARVDSGADPNVDPSTATS